MKMIAALLLIGSVNVFYGIMMGGCQDFILPERKLPQLKLYHEGSDGWNGQYVRLILDDLTHVQCELNDQVVDNSDNLSIVNCQSYA